MSVPDHQIDPPDSYYIEEDVFEMLPASFSQPLIGFDPGQESEPSITMTVPHAWFETSMPLNLGDTITLNGVEGTVTDVDHEADSIRYCVRYLNPCGDVEYSQNTPFVQQIIDIFNLPFPREEDSYMWWEVTKNHSFNTQSSHEKRTRYYLEKYPWWKLWKINKKLEEEKLSPTIDHPRSDIVIGKSKAAGAYYQHNDNFKRFIEELIP